MNFQTETKLLARALEQCAAVTSNQAPFDRVRISVEGDSVTVETQGMDVGASIQIPATILEPGEVVLNAKIAAGILAKSNAAQASVKLTESRCTIDAGARHELVTLGDAPTPEFPDVELKAADRLPFLNSVTSVLYAASTSEARPVMAAVCLDGDYNVATDGHRLARDVSYAPVKCLLSSAAAAKLPRLIVLGDTIRVGVASGRLVIESGAARYSFRLVAGEYPNWRAVVPDELPERAEVDVAEFLAALDRVGVLFSDRFSSVKLETVAGRLSVSTANHEQGEAVDSLPITGNVATVSVNLQYLRQALQAADVETVRIETRDAMTPVLIHGTETLAVVMPLRV